MSSGSGLVQRLRSLLEREGPFVSLYLNTEAGDEEGAREMGLRWRALRAAAAEKGARDAALSAIDDVVAGAQRRGDGLAAFASADDISLALSLSAPIADHVTTGDVPHLLPLLEWRQDNPRVAVVMSDRIGAQIHVLGGLGPERRDDVEGRDFPITNVRAGGSSEPRFHRRAENNWEGNAREVAAELTRVVAGEDIELVVIAGDVRAITFLQEHMDDAIESIALEIESRPEVGLDEVADQLERAVAAYAGQTIEDQLARFREERGQRDRAADGAEATFAALRMAQVERLLVARDEAGSQAWFSPADPTQAALDRSTLDELGLHDVRPAELVDVAVRTALLTGADVTVVPRLGEDHSPREGIGALLRFTT